MGLLWVSCKVAVDVTCFNLLLLSFAVVGDVAVTAGYPLANAMSWLCDEVLGINFKI